MNGKNAARGVVDNGKGKEGMGNAVVMVALVRG